MAGVKSADRDLLRGLGEEILVLMVMGTNREQLTEWLKLPLELSRSKEEEEGDILLKPTECCEIRRQGEALLEIVVKLATPDQWYKWLQMPLGCARRNRQRVLEEHLLAAIAGSSGVYPATRHGVPPRLSFAAGPPADSDCKCPTPDGLDGAAVAVATSPSLDDASPEIVVAPAPSEQVESTSESTTSYSSSPVTVISPPRQSQQVQPTRGALVESDELSLHRATMARDLPRMRKLLAGGVDRNAKDLWSCTALHRAAEQNVAEPVRLLIAAGLNVESRDMEGYTALHFAAARGAEEAIVHLLAAGASLNDRGLNGDTPLHSAVRFLSLSTARMLLEADADEQAKNYDRKTPLQVTGVLPDGREIENEPDPLTAQGIRHLLFAAPARRRFRIWKRRGWFVMLRGRLHARSLQKDEVSETGTVLSEGKGEESGDDGGVAVAEEELEKKMPSGPEKCCGREDVSGVGGNNGGAAPADGGVISEGDSSTERDGSTEAKVTTEADTRTEADAKTEADATTEVDGSRVNAPRDTAFFELVTRATELAEYGLFKKIALYL